MYINSQNLPITYEDNGQIYVLIHLTEPDVEMTTGEVVIWVSLINPYSVSILIAVSWNTHKSLKNVMISFID